MEARVIRVLVTDPSPEVREALSECLSSSGDIAVAGTAENGEEAARKTRELRPDIVTMAIKMPGMNGLEATRQIMAYTPTPILILAPSDPGFAELSFEAMEAGALDVLLRPDVQALSPDAPLVRNLISRIRLLSQVPVIAHLKGRQHQEKEAGPPRGVQPPKKVIAIASSTGGPKQLPPFLAAFPAGLPCAILIVQHIDKGFIGGLVQWLNRRSQVPVSLAQNGDLMEPGKVYIAPDGFHLVVRRGDILGLDDSPPVNGFKPSGNLLLESVARVYGPRAIGVVLSGMGSDGAMGIKAIHDAGGKTVVQDEDTSIVFGMPRAAIKTGCVDYVLPASAIPAKLIQWVTDPFAWHEDGPGKP
jgi:two-component system chemotaxis response regulator CheB